MWELETWHPKVLDVLRNHASLSPSDNFSSFISSQFRHIYKPWWDVLFNGDCWPWRRPNRVSQIWILTHFGIIVPNRCWIGKCWYVAVCFWLTLVRVVRGVAFFFFGNGHTQDDHLTPLLQEAKPSNKHTETWKITPLHSSLPKGTCDILILVGTGLFPTCLQSSGIVHHRAIIATIHSTKKKSLSRGWRSTCPVLPIPHPKSPSPSKNTPHRSPSIPSPHLKVTFKRSSKNCRLRGNTLTIPHDMCKMGWWSPSMGKHWEFRPYHIWPYPGLERSNVKCVCI